MSHLRPLFLALSRMPPALMLVFIIGLAVILTMCASASLSDQIRVNQSLYQSANINAPHKNAVYSRTYIPVGSTIEAKQIELKSTADLELWDDAAQEQGMVVGAKTLHAIPANSQIRKIDLNNGTGSF